MEHIDEFVNYIQNEKNYSHHTVTNYASRLATFFKSLNVSENQLSSKMIRDFINHKSHKRSTIQQYIMSLKSYYRFLVDQGYLLIDPTAKIKFNVKQERLPKYLSKEQVTLLLKTASFFTLKHKLVIQLLYSLGGRVAEVASIQYEAIDFKNQTVTLIGKGNKERVNPIDKDSLELLSLYCHVNNIKQGFIFPHKNKIGLPTTTTALFLLVKTIARKAGIDEKLVSPHKFRHSYAQHLLDNGCDLSIIQELLGHENIETTKIYSKITVSNKKDRFMKYHPLAII